MKLPPNYAKCESEFNNTVKSLEDKLWIFLHVYCSRDDNVHTRDKVIDSTNKGDPP